jgi:hypothetical protein
MKETLLILRADIQADLQAIAEIYTALDRHGAELADEDEGIVVAYYLHNLYSAFESIFQRIAEVFGNHISERAGWHADLLRRMKLDVEGLRPRVISDEAYVCLDELRRFRHLFRGAYRLHLDPDRLIVVRNQALRLRSVYQTDLEGLVTFLGELLRAA